MFNTKRKEEREKRRREGNRGAGKEEGGEGWIHLLATPDY